MSHTLTAEDLLPLVARLDPRERPRLVRLIEVAAERDAAAYLAMPVREDEFGTDEEPLAWEAEGWGTLP